MKTNLLITAIALTAALFCITPEGKAQETISEDPKARSGIRAGIGASNLYIKNVTDRNPRYGFHAGIFTQVPLIKGVLYLQPELSYSAKGVTARYSALNGNLSGENSFKLDYLEVPLLATFKVGNFVDLHGGLYGSYLLSATTEGKGDITFNNTLNRDNFNNFDYGVSAGLSIYLGKFMVGTRYNYGLRPVAYTNAAKAFLGDAKNSAGQVSVGFTF